MDTKYEPTGHDSDSEAVQKIVYVRPVAVKDLPQDVQDRVVGAEEIYAVHTEDGARLALVRSRDLAFVLARQNDMAPVHVH